MQLKPWRELVTPHADVLRGTFNQSEFAADISRVHTRTSTEEYQNPALFFQRTFITEGMKHLLHSVLQRLAGKGGDPVIQLQTAFGGAKPTRCWRSITWLPPPVHPATCRGCLPCWTKQG